MIPILVLTNEECDHIRHSKNNRTYNNRIRKILRTISNGSFYEFLDNFVESDQLIQCNWCNSFKSFKSFNFKIVSNILYLDDIEYHSDANICARKDTYITKNCKYKVLNPNSAEFVEKSRNFNSRESAIEYIHTRNKTPFYANNHDNLLDYSKWQRRDAERLGEEKYRKMIDKIVLHNSKDYVVLKYGIEEWERRCKSRDTMSLNHIKEKYGDNFEEYEKRIQSIRVDLDSLILKYGELEGKERYRRYTERLSTSKKKFLEKTTANERSFLYDTNSVNRFKRKYGEKWEEYYKKHRKMLNVKTSKASKESMKFYNLLLDKMKNIDVKYYIGYGDNKEWYINDGIHFRTYDFCIPELKIIIEFHGSLWHYNPNFTYSELPFGMSIEKHKENDLIKQNLAESKGFNYYVVFDTDDYMFKCDEMFDIINHQYNRKENKV